MKTFLLILALEQEEPFKLNNLYFLYAAIKKPWLHQKNEKVHRMAVLLVPVGKSTETRMKKRFLRIGYKCTSH